MVSRGSVAVTLVFLIAGIGRSSARNDVMADAETAMRNPTLCLRVGKIRDASSN